MVATAPPINLCSEHTGSAIRELVGRQGHKAQWDQVTEQHLVANPPTQPQAKPDWVYFLRREELIKIGYSNSPKRRAMQLCATLLATTPGSRAEEARWHQKFRHLHAGGEWFRPGADLVATINVLRRADLLPPITAGEQLAELPDLL
ncbi:MAG: GIY-YIG nuclease family protein [Candidatus Paceibacterota bacterium]